MLTDNTRFSYSGISTRNSFEWPDGKRIAFYIALNIEHFPFGEGGGIDGGTHGGEDGGTHGGGTHGGLDGGLTGGGADGGGADGYDAPRTQQ